MNQNNEEITRREFVKQSVVWTAMLAGASTGALALPPPPVDLARAVVGELGGLFIPSRPGDPGYKDLEQHGITEYVLKNLPVGGRAIAGEGEVHEIGGDGILGEFNNAA